MGIKRGLSKKLEKRPKPIKISSGAFNKLEITKGLDKLLNFALVGEKPSEEQVNSVQNSVDTFILGVSLSRLQIINKILTGLESIEGKMIAAVNSEKISNSYLIKFHERLLERLDKEMKYLSKKEGYEEILQVYNDNRQISVGNNNALKNVSETPILPQEGRAKLTRLVDSVLRNAVK